MRPSPSVRRTQALALAAAAFVVLLSSNSACHAGILLPDAISFDASDLEREFNASQEDGAGSAPAKSHAPASPSKQNNENPELLKAALPSGNSSSSSSSSSSSGGATVSNAVLCAFSSTVTIDDETLLTRVAEDHALSLPDPAGIDLLRPPRSLLT